MRSRIAKHVHRDVAKEIQLSTFHSFCFWVLKQEIHHLGYTQNFTVYDEKDRERLIQTLEKQLQEEHETVDEPLLLSEFVKSLKAYNAVDFDGLLTLTLESGVLDLFHHRQ